MDLQNILPIPWAVVEPKNLLHKFLTTAKSSFVVVAFINGVVVVVVPDSGEGMGGCPSEQGVSSSSEVNRVMFWSWFNLILVGKPRF